MTEKRLTLVADEFSASGSFWLDELRKTSTCHTEWIALKTEEQDRITETFPGQTAGLCLHGKKYLHLFEGVSYTLHLYQKCAPFWELAYTRWHHLTLRFGTYEAHFTRYFITPWQKKHQFSVIDIHPGIVIHPDGYWYITPWVYPNHTRGVSIFPTRISRNSCIPPRCFQIPPIVGQCRYASASLHLHFEYHTVTYTQV